MKKIIYFLAIAMILFIQSCQSNLEKARHNLDEKIDEAERLISENKFNLSDTTMFDSDKENDTAKIEIKLNQEIIFNWNNENSKIEYDMEWFMLLGNLENIQPQLVGLISDTSETTAYGCPARTKLTKGQLAYIVLDDIHELPEFELFKVQFDAVRMGCHYPDGLLDYVRRESSFVQTCVKDYLSK